MSEIRLYVIRAYRKDQANVHCSVLQAYTAADALVQWQVQKASRPMYVNEAPLTIEPIDVLDERLDAWRDEDHPNCLRRDARPEWYEPEAVKA